MLAIAIDMINGPGRSWRAAHETDAVNPRQQLVFVQLMTGPETLPFRDRPDPAAELVATLLAGLSPGPSPNETEPRP